MQDVTGRLVIAPAGEADWAVVREWAADEGWNPGLDDTPSFFAQDPEGFFLGRIDGEPVSAVSVVNYDERYAFLGFYLVRPDLRGRGYGLATWNAGLKHAGQRTVGLDGVVAQQSNYRRSGFAPAHRTARYTGVPRPSAGHHADGVRHATAADVPELHAYDSACQPADRPRFLDLWLTTPGHTVLVRHSGRHITGYGVVRPGTDMPRIGPLFADSAADASALLSALAPPQGPVAIDVPEVNGPAVALAEAHGLTPGFETARMYTGPVRPHAQDRIFGVTTLELG